MKKFTKTASLVLAVVLACSLMTCAFAAETTNPIVGLFVTKAAANAAGNAFGDAIENALENSFEVGGENVGSYYENLGEKFADEVSAWAHGKGAETGVSGFMALVKQLVSDTTNAGQVEAAAAGTTSTLAADAGAVTANDVDAGFSVPTLPQLDNETVKGAFDTMVKIGVAHIIAEIIF